MKMPLPGTIPVFARGKTDGTFNVNWLKPPNHSAANAQFFDPDPRCLVQLRPMLKSEVYSNGAGREANAILFVRGEGLAPDLMLFVRNPPHLMKNNRAGVVRAMRCVEKFDRPIAVHIWEVIARTRWPDQA